MDFNQLLTFIRCYRLIIKANISSLFIKNREEHLVYIKITEIYDYTNNKDLYNY